MNAGGAVLWFKKFFFLLIKLTFPNSALNSLALQVYLGPLADFHRPLGNAFQEKRTDEHRRTVDSDSFSGSFHGERGSDFKYLVKVFFGRQEENKCVRYKINN